MERELRRAPSDYLEFKRIARPSIQKYPTELALDRNRSVQIFHGHTVQLDDFVAGLA